jgi:hypothetical protein
MDILYSYLCFHTAPLVNNIDSVRGTGFYIRYKVSISSHASVAKQATGNLRFAILYGLAAWSAWSYKPPVCSANTMAGVEEHEREKAAEMRLSKVHFSSDSEPHITSNKIDERMLRNTASGP